MKNYLTVCVLSLIMLLSLITTLGVLLGEQVQVSEHLVNVPRNLTMLAKLERKLKPCQ
jgi:hypothetical protein